jgi:hypothetical protein
MGNDQGLVPYSEGAENGDLAVREAAAYDDSLELAGKIAEHLARGQKFAWYHQTKAKNTLERQQYDLQVFSTYLAQAGITRSAEDLFLDAGAWRGMNSGLLEGFRTWMLNEGYAIGSINLRLSTIRKYCELAFATGIISSQDLALIKLVKGFPTVKAPTSTVTGRRRDTARASEPRRPRPRMCQSSRPYV